MSEGPHSSITPGLRTHRAVHRAVPKGSQPSGSDVHGGRMVRVRSSSHGALLSLHIILDVHWIQSYSGQLMVTAKRCKELKIVPDQAIKAHMKLKCP